MTKSSLGISSQKLTRRTALATGAAAAFSVRPAWADEAAEAYVGSAIEEANALSGKPEPEWLKGIEAIVAKYVDMRRVGRFVLGQYARAMTSEQKSVYEPVFRRYATNIYQNVLSGYSDRQLEVTGSRDRSPRDIVVTSRIKDARPGDAFGNTVFGWRVYRDRSGNMSVVDAGADGIWLAIEQRGQFVSTIANNGGRQQGIDALISQLREKTGV